VRQTLVADVVRTWLQVRELQGQLALSRSTITSYRHTVSMVEQRYARGMVPAFEVHLARQNLLNAEATAPEQERLLAEATRRLQILAGRYPSGRGLESGRPDTTSTPGSGYDLAQALPAPLPAVPAGLPSSLLERRPDLFAAEAGLHASTANVGAAKARLFPTLSLTGSAGYTSNDLSTWFDSGTDVWSLVAGLAMPLLNRGATRAQVEAAEARAAQALAAYHQAVLVAFGEVENALDADRHHAEREQLLLAAVQEAQRALDLAQQRYGSGRSVTVFGNNDDAHRTARVNLILALGGPWDAATAMASEGDHE